jgi:diguanylate cyclase (GGDEF)-like protein/PAS domain S-box-containing protein
MARVRRLSRPLIAGAAVLLSASLWAGGYLGRLETAVADAAARALRREVASDIVIVGIDAQSLAELSVWPWPRRHHAELLDRLAIAGAGRIFIDIDFSVPRDPADDARLAAALARFADEPVILPAFHQQATGASGHLLLTRPMDQLTRHARLVSVNLLPGADGLVRELPRVWQTEGVNLPSVAGLLGGAGVDDGVLRIDYSIAPSSFAFVSYADVVGDRVATAVFRDKTVFVGATAIELGDNLAVPVYGSLPGVVLQALATETARQGAPRALPRAAYLLLLTGWTTLCTLLFTGSWRRNAIVFALALAAVAILGLHLAAAWRIALDVVPLWLAPATVFLLLTLRSLDQQTLRALAYGIGLRNRDALLKSIFESSSDAIVCMDAQGVVRMANAAAGKLLQAEGDMLRGAPIVRFIPQLDRSLPLVMSALRELDVRTAAGELLPVELSISRVHGHDDELFTAIMRDIRERRAQQRRLEHEATHDSLTTLPNRAALFAHLEAMLATATADCPASLLMLDLCRFKEVNDTLGHPVGDFVLTEVARRFRQAVGAEGLVARIGGDEFTVALAPGSTSAEALCARLHECLAAPIDADGIAIDIGVSIGIAACPTDAADATALLQRADIAMYDAKRRGSKYERYDPARDQSSVRRLRMVGELRSAIAGDGLTLHYQPQVDLRSGRVGGVEALLRWQHPELGRVSPAEFIAAAEASDLIAPLTDWTLGEAVRQAGIWRAAGFELRIAVNLSARVLQDPAFVGRVRTLLDSGAIRPELLELELTESAMMLDPAHALEVMRQIHGLGVRVAVDDFGTGYSSLGYLRDLPVHAVKLDKSFVFGLNARPEDRVIVESTVRMAHALGIEAVAEGVSDVATAARLEELGYDYGQGFLYSPALAPDACLDWIGRFNARTDAATSRAA